MRGRDTGCVIVLKTPVMDTRAMRAPSRNAAVGPGEVCIFFTPLLAFVKYGRMISPLSYAS